MMKSFEFPKVYSADWFEVDQPTMDAIIVGIDELVKSIIAWEEMNVTPGCNAWRKEKPYGAYLTHTGYLPFEHWIENDSGGWETMDTLEARIDHELKMQKYRKKKLPEGAIQLIAEKFPEKLNAIKA
jgi:hypothetical protein